MIALKIILIALACLAGGVVVITYGLEKLGYRYGQLERARHWIVRAFIGLVILNFIVGVGMIVLDTV